MIEDREYMKRELARIYSPQEALKQTRWNRNRNAYTARQVRLIAEYLCID